MGLVRKIIYFYMLLIVSFIGVFLFMGHQVWNQNYLKLEQDEVRDNVTRAHLAWQGEIESMASEVADWAPWDDLYQFARDRGESDFAEKNLSDAAMANLRIDVVVITDPQGQMIFAKEIDPEKKSQVGVSSELTRQIANLIQAKLPVADSDQGVKGFVMLANEPVFIAMERILTSDKQGPSSGALVFIKHVDGLLLSQISNKTQVDIQFEQYSEGATNRQETSLYVTEDDFIRAYDPVEDLYGNNEYYLVSTVPREIYKQGQVQMKDFLLFVIGFGLLFTGITFFLLNEVVLSRIRKVDSFMNAVIKQGDYSIRLTLPGQDELSRVATTMNTMLTRIEQSQKKITDLYHSGQDELEERRRTEKKLLYQSTHDKLTGLYNRYYFEKELENILTQKPVGIGFVCGDVDGLKLINDTLGHAAGDQMLILAAETLTHVFADKGVVARVDGDGFAAILTGITADDLDQLCQQVKDFAEYNQPQVMDIEMRLSFGWKYYGGKNINKDILNNLLRQADDQMYRQKLSSSYSNRSTLVQGMLEMLKVRDFITEGHSQRLQDHVIRLGGEIGLKEPQLADLALLAQFHDIGKVGIPDSILLKPGRLTQEERIEMERHSLLGHRIAQAIPELTPIADFILKHHEWWNGEGYPLGLRGEEIPIEDRILAVADAYDAMISNRPYRQAMPAEAAFAELRRNAGTQFEPHLVEKFIEIVQY